MNEGLLALLWLMSVLVAGAWLLSASSVSLALPGAVGNLRDPVVRGRRLLLLALVPWATVTTVGSALLAIAAGKAIGWIADHCLHHGPGHPHLCFAHLPAMELGWIHGLFAVAAVGLVIPGAVRLGRSEYRAMRAFRALAALAAPRGRLRIVSAPTCFAVAGGLFQPVVLCSRGLLDQLSFRERRIVLAHEAAHLRNGDVRRNLLFEALLFLHLPVTRRRLRREWLRSLEERADDDVARRFGADSVVATLLRVARLKLHSPAPGFSMAGANLTHRANRLLDHHAVHATRRPAFEIVFALCVPAAFAAAVTGHHALETLLGLIGGH